MISGGMIGVCGSILTDCSDERTGWSRDTFGVWPVSLDAGEKVLFEAEVECLTQPKAGQNVV